METHILTGLCTSRLGACLSPTTKNTFSSCSPRRSSSSRFFWTLSTCLTSAFMALSHWVCETGRSSRAGRAGSARGATEAGFHRGGGACEDDEVDVTVAMADMALQVRGALLAGAERGQRGARRRGSAPTLSSRLVSSKLITRLSSVGRGLAPFLRIPPIRDTYRFAQFHSDTRRDTMLCTVRMRIGGTVGRGRGDPRCGWTRTGGRDGWWTDVRGPRNHDDDDDDGTDRNFERDLETRTTTTRRRTAAAERRTLPLPYSAAALLVPPPADPQALPPSTRRHRSAASVLAVRAVLRDGLLARAPKRALAALARAHADAHAGARRAPARAVRPAAAAARAGARRRAGDADRARGRRAAALGGLGVRDVGGGGDGGADRLRRRHARLGHGVVARVKVLALLRGRASELVSLESSRRCCGGERAGSGRAHLELVGEEVLLRGHLAVLLEELLLLLRKGLDEGARARARG